MGSPPVSEPTSTEATWREIGHQVDSISQLAKSEESPGKFYAALIERLVAALAAQGGAIWTRDGSGKLQQECLVNPPHPWICSGQTGESSHGDLVSNVLASGQPRLVPPQWKPSPSDPTANPT